MCKVLFFTKIQLPISTSLILSSLCHSGRTPFIIPVMGLKPNDPKLCINDACMWAPRRCYMDSRYPKAVPFLFFGPLKRTPHTKLFNRTVRNVRSW